MEQPETVEAGGDTVTDGDPVAIVDAVRCARVLPADWPVSAESKTSIFQPLPPKAALGRTATAITKAEPCASS
jgi:hypothetical protein